MALVSWLIVALNISDLRSPVDAYSKKMVFALMFGSALKNCLSCSLDGMPVIGTKLILGNFSVATHSLFLRKSLENRLIAHNSQRYVLGFKFWLLALNKKSLILLASIVLPISLMKRFKAQRCTTTVLSESCKSTRQNLAKLSNMESVIVKLGSAELWCFKADNRKVESSNLSRPTFL